MTGRQPPAARGASPAAGTGGASAAARAAVLRAGRAMLLLLLPAACAAPAAPAGPGQPAVRLSASFGAGCVARGAAVFLGEGRFLTAAHLVDGSLTPPACDGPPRLALLLGDRAVAARVERLGQSEVDPAEGLRYRGGHDLALLAAEEPLPALPGLRAARPCAGDPGPGRPVAVATPRRSARTTVVAQAPEADPAFGTYAELQLRLEPGESGGGAFDPVSGCLLGVVSHREEGEPGTRVVPPAAIRAFLAE
ncbi:trypsin-like peptidase domain-containing protein [Roseomonas sp. BN140053]|uniref:trypsin-like peptidase domain-containing protein n=1 Tax=Roseomonas sp. BN140053 TaxID=3391898 RepID=UPI0039E995A9